MLDAAEKLLGVASMRARGGVGREDDFCAARTHRERAYLEVARQVALHDSHPFIREPTGSHVPRSVLEIVLNHQADLWTDIGTHLHGGVDILLRGVGQVLYLAASSAGGGARLSAVRMHHRPQPDRRGFAAEYAELVLGERRPGAHALAPRREDLDEIRALLLSPPDHRAE